MYSPELQSKFAIWGAKVADGTITEPEMIEAIRQLRSERLSAYQASDSRRRSAAKAEIPNAGDLLKEMGL